MAKADMTLTATRIVAGVWEGVLAGAGRDVPVIGVPVIEVLLGDRVLDGVEVTALKPGRYAVRVPIPADALADGVQTYLIRSDGATLAQFAVIAGAATDTNLYAEIDLLRAELDLLKRAFRRHCAETAGQDQIS